jgi:hypothetical protein
MNNFNPNVVIGTTMVIIWIIGLYNVWSIK